MLRSRLTVPLVVVGLVAVAVPVALQAQTSSSPAKVTVTAGVPRELAFKVSPSKFTASSAMFTVTNKGKLSHSFKVCTKASTSAKANSCTGVGTKLLAPGATATLTVKLPVSGSYEYLSGLASEAKAGMKGLVVVQVPVTLGSGAGGAGGGSSTGSGGGSGGGGGNGGGVVNGQATDPACPAGTLVPVGPGAGDQDDDNEGGFPSDLDGCV